MKKGYSILEVMLAFAILSIAIIPIISMYPSIFKTNFKAAAIEETSRLCLTVVDYIKARGYNNLTTTGAILSENFVTKEYKYNTETTYWENTKSNTFEEDFGYTMNGLFILNTKGLNINDIKLTINITFADTSLLKTDKITVDNTFTSPFTTQAGLLFPKDKAFIIGKVKVEVENSNKSSSEVLFIITPIENWR